MMLVAPEEGAVSLNILSDHHSHAPIIAPLQPEGALQAWVGTSH